MARPRSAPLLSVLVLAPLLAGGCAAPGPHEIRARAVESVSAERLEEDLTALVGFGTRHTASETGSETRGIGAARRWLRDRYEAIARSRDVGLSVEMRAHEVSGRRLPGTVEVVNVVATLPGADPDRVLIVSGHYDSRNSDPTDAVGDAPGAVDDGAGTVAVLEACRVIAAALDEAAGAAAARGEPPPRPRASVRFCAVAGEEQGLYGSREMARADAASGVRVVGMITNDIVGAVEGGHGRKNRGHLRVFSEGVPSGEDAPRVVGSDNDAPSRQLARAVVERAAIDVPDIELLHVFRQDRYLRGGDHRSYNELGEAGIRLTDLWEHFDRQHQDVRVEDERAYGDVLEHVDFEHLEDVTQANVAALLALAFAPPAPTGVRVDVSGLSHDTRLYWDDPKDPGVAGYRVRMRPTDAPVWTAARDVGDVHEVVLEGASKDHVLFAVEAYDADGLTSVPVYPTPGR